MPLEAFRPVSHDKLDDVAPVAEKADRRAWIGLAALALPAFIYSMDLTVLHLAVPQITQALKPTSAQLLWMVDIYGFMIAGALVTMGTLGDRIGRRLLLLIGAAAFGVTSLMAAFAPSAEMLVVARALQGLAGATLAPSTLSLIRNMFHDEYERRFAIGVWVAAFSVGAVAGPLVGGAILSQFWWGAVFLINVPIMLLLLAVGPVLLPEFRDPHAGRMDVVGAAQSLAAVLLLIYGMKRIAEAGPQAVNFFAILAGVLIGIAFFRRQARLADPLIDVTLIRKRTFAAALGANIAGPFIVIGVFLFLAQYLQLVLGMGPLEAGLWLAPSGMVFAVGSLAAAPLVRVFSPARILTAGFLLSAVGFVILTWIESAEGPELALVAMLVFSAGIAPLGTITTDLILGAAPPERAGAASAISETSFEFGGALGIAVLGSVVTAAYRTAMDRADLDGLPAHAVTEAKDTLGGAIAVAETLSADRGAVLLETARDAFVHAFAVSAGISALLSFAAALMAAAFLRGAGR